MSVLTPGVLRLDIPELSRRDPDDLKIVEAAVEGRTAYLLKRRPNGKAEWHKPDSLAAIQSVRILMEPLEKFPDISSRSTLMICSQPF